MSLVIAGCEERGFCRMIAVIGDRAWLGSIRPHEQAGFAHEGVLPSVGFKHDGWRDIILMQRTPDPGDRQPPRYRAPMMNHPRLGLAGIRVNCILMMKSLRLSLAFVASIFAGLALPPFASAQLYERILPIDEILYAVVERGFEPISLPQLSGDVYVVDVIDPRGRPSRLSVDAFDGVIIGSLRPRIVEPERIVREAPLRPFDGRPSGYRGEGLRVFPDGSVRDLRDPSTRSLTDPGSSVRIERVPAPRDSARARQDLPEIAPLPPVRPDRLAARPDVELDPGPARRALPEAARTQQEAAPTPEISERQRSVIERTTPVPRSAPLRSETRAQAPAQQIERAPTPRRDDLLDDVSPDEIDQMDMYPSRSRIR